MVLQEEEEAVAAGLLSAAMKRLQCRRLEALAGLLGVATVLCLCLPKYRPRAWLPLQLLTSAHSRLVHPFALLVPQLVLSLPPLHLQSESFVQPLLRSCLQPG